MSVANPASSERVLVIDDEAVTRMMVREVLEGAGYVVEEASDGDVGLEKARDNLPDLVLLDVRMPTLNGFETCKQLRLIPDGEHLPILMLTGLDDVVSAQLAFDSGATDFITKPINWTLLAQRLNYALRVKERDEQLRQSEARLVHAQRLARLGQWHLLAHSNRVVLSNTLSEDLELPPGELTVNELLRRVHPKDRHGLLQCIRKVFVAGDAQEHEFRVLTPSGKVCVVHLFAEPGAMGRGQLLEGTLQDVSARIEVEAKISYFAHYDSLTELPNRILFYDRLTHSVADAKRNNQRLAVLVMGLDRFSDLNATMGHSLGDRVLREVASRLSECSRESDTLSRLGGDEFALICLGLNKQSDIDGLLGRILSRFEEPFKEAGIDAHLGLSVGVALYPDDGEDLETLLMHADAAKSRAKSSPGASYEFYTAAMGEGARARIEMEAALREALAEDAFELHYQPLVSLRDSSVWGVEALLRWRHPEKGLVLPGDFIPVLEETGLLHDVGDWIVRRACLDMKQHEFVVSINVSPIQFRDARLFERISGALDATAFPASRFQVEITENLLIQDRWSATETINALRNVDVLVAIDDFGTGYSSLTYLRDYAADFLKIDRSFLGNLAADQANQAIVRSTIGLGHDLGMRIIGEGVEDKSALEALAHMGCDVAQGFLIARPMDLEALGRWLASRD